MAYTTLANIKKYMPAKQIEQLTDDYGTGSIVQEIADDVIAQSRKTIDASMKGRYPDDIEDVDLPAMIVDLATRLSVYYLFRRKLQTTLPEAIARDHKDCMITLKDIQSGKITPFPTADEPTIIKTNKESTDRIYDSTLWATY